MMLNIKTSVVILSVTLAVLGVLATAAMAQSTGTGTVFDHIFIIWLENTNYADALNNTDLQAFAKEGITLTKYYAVTHPSEPNYIAAAGGNYFGLADDAFHSIPANYSTIVDLLEPKGLTWKAYQENMPSTCYTGLEFNGTYFRKHNPFIIYDSISTNTSRCSNVVPDTQLASDLANNSLPNYAFFTPNMLNDGHNTSVTYAGAWLTSFLKPLLTTFPKKTLVVVTFDESENYTVPNNVWAVLLGNVVPPRLKNTTDDTFYTHYSLLSTVEANWGLGSLHLNDAKSPLNNVFSFVAQACNVTNQNVTTPPLLNGTEPGFLASTTSTPIPTTANPMSTSSGSSSVSPSVSSGTAKSIISGASFVVVDVAAAML